MTEPFNDDLLAELGEQVDVQLTALKRAELRGTLRGAELPEPQRDAIERETGEAAPGFLERFREAARQDLCEHGGVLYAQWQKWGNLGNKDVLKGFGAILVAMGFSGNALQVLAVALGVIALHIGVKAFCAG